MAPGPKRLNTFLLLAYTMCYMSEHPKNGSKQKSGQKVILSMLQL